MSAKRRHSKIAEHGWAVLGTCPVDVVQNSCST
jgi:hypothetical protein